MTNEINNNFKNKLKNKSILILFILFIFFLGIWTERFDIDKKASNKFKNLIDTSSQLIYSLGKNEEIFINIKPKSYKKILKSRQLSLEKGRATESIQSWVPATLKHKDKTYNVELSLKGTHSDHWQHKSKWSFKIKVRNDEKSIFGLRRFAVQAPYTISYLYEWLFMKALAKENLINLDVKFLNVIVNDNNLGTYVLQEKISPKLIEKTQRDPGPIIGFSKTLWVQEANNYKNLGANGIDESFWRAKIEPTQFDKNLLGTDQENLLNDAIFLLESFRNKTLKTSEVFDTKQLAKVMAIRAVLGSSQFDWKDQKFYYNPNTSFLEPISKEIHVDLNYEDKINFWWADSGRVKDHLASDVDFFLDLLYSDIEFYKIYLKELNQISSAKYFESLINENKDEFKKFRRMVKYNYPTKKIFSQNFLEVKRKQIQSTLNPLQGLNVYFLSYQKNILKLNVSNLQRLPIEVTELHLSSGFKIKLKSKIVIKGKKPHKPLTNNIISIACESKNECSKSLIKNQKLKFNILGQDNSKFAEIAEHYYAKDKKK